MILFSILRELVVMLSGSNLLTHCSNSVTRLECSRQTVCTRLLARNYVIVYISGFFTTDISVKYLTFSYFVAVSRLMLEMC